MKNATSEDNAEMNGSRKDFLIVGIGASAGGVEALQTFFKNVPVNSGIAYVVILHLSPDFDSQLVHILKNCTPIRIIKLIERIHVEPDTIYVISPNYHLTMDDGHIEVTQNIRMEERRAPVDIFFRTLAESHADRAVSVILSGTGANGSMGLKRVKERGGAVFVQAPDEARFSEMPRNAIATDLVDAVLDVARIPERIVSYRNSLSTVEIAVQPEKRPEDDQHALREIFTQLRIRTGHDFANYKRATILRRIQRRISVCELPNLKAYAKYLYDTPEETHALLKDLLISVTNFFRDQTSFERLEKEIVPRLLEGKNAENTVRVWIAGCATGEEAYSLAIMLAERTFGIADAPKIELFASDIDEHSISVARDGFYTLNDAADVSSDRLHRFFNAEANGYRIKREIREMILFANHNLIKDPPFSRVDLITCRNLLIYFNSTAQERVMETAHFALNPGGYLFLGSSESVNGATDLFMQVSKEANIYQSRPLATRIAYPIPESVPSFRVSKQVTRLQDNNTEPRNNRSRERMTYGDLHQQLLEQFAPPSVVVNEEYDIVHLSDKAGRFLQVSGGEPTQNLLKLIRSELRLELRTALYQAVQQQINIKARNLKVQLDERTESVDIHIRPVMTEQNGARGFILVIFEIVNDTDETKEVVYASAEPIAHQLEDELIRVKSQLRASAEQFEIQAEELKASNEELQAMNEELRSAAEELETSKEELQSINEELITVNQELKVKIEEISQTNNNFQNLVNSSDIPTIFLDRQFRVNMFTPAAKEVFNLIQHDIGRPISDITSRLAYEELMADAELVLQKLQSIEREVTTTDDKTYLLRISPYRTAEDRISGVVIVFVNITDRKKSEEALQYSETKLRIVMKSSGIGIWLWNIEEDKFEADNSILDLMGNPSQGVIDMAKIRSAIHPDDQSLFSEAIDTAKDAAGNGLLNIEYRIAQPDGKLLWLHSTAQTFFDGVPKHPVMMVGSITDITGRKESEVILRKSEERFRTIFNQSTAAVAECDAQGNYMLVNDTFASALGYFPDELIGVNMRDMIHPDDLPRCIELFNKATETGQSFTNEKRLLSNNGSYIWVTDSICPLGIRDGRAERMLSVGIDITNRKKTEIFIHESEQRYRIALEAGELATWDWNLKTDKVAWNEQHFRLFGIRCEEDTLSPEYFLEFIYPEDIALVKQQMAEVMGKSGIYTAEFRIRRKDNGKLRWMSGYGRVTEREDGEPTRVSGVMYDSTDRREAENKLEDTKNSLNTALEAAKMGVWSMDMQYGYVDRSPRHDQLLGFEDWQEDWSREKAKTNIHEEDRSKFDIAYQSLISEGVFDLEARVKQSDGSLCWIHYYGRAFKNEDGKGETAAGVIFDITDQKTIEKQKDEFIGIASHELKTPVTTIKAYAEILQEMFTHKNDLVSADLMRKLDGQVNRLTNLIKDLLDVTKVSEGQLHLVTKSFSMEAMIQNVAEEIQRATRQHRIKIKIAPLPDVVGDEERLGQVLTNLLSNAIKYSPEAKDVWVDAKYESETVSISVRDFGIGMSPGTLEKLFGRFFRSENPSVRSYPGLGLGLFISMEIMKRHGGTITVESEKEKGSVFTMVLPFA